LARSAKINAQRKTKNEKLRLARSAKNYKNQKAGETPAFFHFGASAPHPKFLDFGY
jgi:hypothetical protein